MPEETQRDNGFVVDDYIMSIITKESVRFADSLQPMIANFFLCKQNHELGDDTPSPWEDYGQGKFNLVQHEVCSRYFIAKLSFPLILMLFIYIFCSFSIIDLFLLLSFYTIFRLYSSIVLLKAIAPMLLFQSNLHLII